MIELPEAKTLSRQLITATKGKKIARVIAAQTPHKFAFYSGNPNLYNGWLQERKIISAMSYGGWVELETEDKTLLFTDGVNLRFHQKSGEVPQKHQLLIYFSDESALSATISMYGCLLSVSKGKNENLYYLNAKAKPSPLNEKFDLTYFFNLFTPQEDKLSLKAFLATNQRIPGLGNGVLQDILFYAKLNPKKKVNTLNEQDRYLLFSSIKNTINDMAELGGRDTEKDLFGNTGGYQTLLSRNTLMDPCPNCGSKIVKEAFLGGSVYYCSVCQSI